MARPTAGVLLLGIMAGSLAASAASAASLAAAPASANTVPASPAATVASVNKWPFPPAPAPASVSKVPAPAAPAATSVKKVPTPAAPTVASTGKVPAPAAPAVASANRKVSVPVAPAATSVNKVSASPAPATASANQMPAAPALSATSVNKAPAPAAPVVASAAAAAVSPATAAASVAAVAALPALAAATPPAPAGALDPRIRYIAYGENRIYRIILDLKSVSAVQFSDSEEVESILIGDSASWEIVKLKNGHVVSIKATIPFAETNMTIYTDRRVYTFELRSRGEFSAGAGAPPPFRSVFTYPSEKKPQPAAVPPLPERVDSNYMVSGEAEFRPTWVQDNGHQTSFFLPAGSPRPAIFKVGRGNEEQLINSRTLGNQIIVDGTSDYWVLRIGDQSVCIARSHAVQTTSRTTANRRPGDSHE